MPDAPYPLLDPRLPVPRIVPSNLLDHAAELDSHGEPTAPDTSDSLDPLDDDTFPWDAFPDPVRAWLRHTATTTGVGPDAVAFPVLAIAGAAIGAIHALRVAPGWIERPILWVALVGQVGTGKSPAIAAPSMPSRNAPGMPPGTPAPSPGPAPASPSASGASPPEGG